MSLLVELAPAPGSFNSARSVSMRRLVQPYLYSAWTLSRRTNTLAFASLLGSLSLNYLHTHLSPQHQPRCPLTLLVWTWEFILLHTALTTMSGSCVCGAITVIIKGGYKDAKGVVYVFRCISDLLSLTLLLHSCHCTSCKKRGGSRASQTLSSLSNVEY
jgi:hypothetical protein